MASFPISQWNSSDQGTNDTYGISDSDEMDTTHHFFPNEIWGVKPAWEIAVKVVTIIPIVFMGILGNSSLIYVIIRTRSLQTNTNLLVANMAFADLGTLLICPWMLLCNDFFQNYIFGAIGCHIEGFVTHALTLVAVLSLSAVSYDRVTAIVLRCSGKLSQRSARVLICITWLVGIAVAAPLAFFRYYRTRQWIDFLELYCTEDPAYIGLYWSIFVCISVWLPLAIMAVSYSAILIKLDKYETLALKSKNPIAMKFKGKVTRILAVVVLVFIICRVPFTVLVLQRTKLFHQLPTQEMIDSLHYLWYTARYLVLLNAAVDPILYGFTSSSLRRALSSCPTLTWILRKRKINCAQRCGANLPSMPDKCAVLIPRSPCFCSDNQREPLPNISSNIEPPIYSHHGLKIINQI